VDATGFALTMAAIPTHPPAPHHPVAQTLARLHDWVDFVPQQQRRLWLFIVLAAMVHIGAFFFISIDNTLPELRHEVRTEVTLDNAAIGTPEAPEEAYFDMLNDPRLYVLPQPSEAPPPAASPFEADELHPVAMPAPAEIGSFPFLNQPLPSLAQRVNESLQPARQPFDYEENPASMARSTTWQWGPALAGRAPVGVPTLPSPVSDTEITPTRLRVAVGPDGAVSDVMLDQSSQQPDLDQQAILAAQKVRFQPTGQPGLAWGEVTIAWYYTPKPQEVAPPPAPLAP
jgi:TonB family protein